MYESDPLRQHELMVTRRQLFGRSALGLGTAAMAGLIGDELSATWPDRLRRLRSLIGSFDFERP